MSCSSFLQSLVFLFYEYFYCWLNTGWFHHLTTQPARSTTEHISFSFRNMLYKDSYRTTGHRDLTRSSSCDLNITLCTEGRKYGYTGPRSCFKFETLIENLKKSRACKTILSEFSFNSQIQLLKLWLNTNLPNVCCQ